MNKVVLIGRLGKDPELRQSRGGQPWGTLAVATDRARREGDQWVEETDWHQVRVFGKQAERCQRFLRRGSLVAVDGSLVYEKWTAQDGTSRTSTRILADRVTFLGGLSPRDEASPAEEGEAAHASA